MLLYCYITVSFYTTLPLLFLPLPPSSLLPPSFYFSSPFSYFCLFALLWFEQQHRDEFQQTRSQAYCNPFELGVMCTQKHGRIKGGLT